MGKTTRKIGRLAKLGTLSSKVSGSYLSQKIRSSFQSKETENEDLQHTHKENAERIVDVMVDLKGAAMKVGQSIAVIADSLDLPQEVSSILSRLHDQATIVPFEKIESVVRAEFENQEQKFPFLSIDPIPLGTASLAQAHAATLHNGKQVVIKVLHEGVEDSVDTDLQALKKILQVGRFWKRSREEIDILFDEIRLRLLEELDYERELLHLQYFYKVFADIDGIRTPYPYQEFSTKRVLTMQRLLGMPLETFCERADKKAKKRAGDLLCMAFHEMAYIQRAIHADPHGGNYLFQIDGSIGILDFGCVKRYDQQFISVYSQFGNALVDGHRDELMMLAKELGIISMESTSPELEDALWDLACAVAKVFQQDIYFIGGDHDTLIEDIKNTSKKLLSYSDVRGPRNMIFLHRTLMGIYSMLRKLKHFGHYEQFRRKFANTAISRFKGEEKDVSFFIDFDSQVVK
jgi:predicted unusual protein kinase regulating ubiquinone biosynthesis (AarF/ABC1/UbiB family)